MSPRQVGITVYAVSTRCDAPGSSATGMPVTATVGSVPSISTRCHRAIGGFDVQVDVAPHADGEGGRQYAGEPRRRRLPGAAGQQEVAG